ncbi:hypothetical protein DFS34DRAFT_399293 [Phlyctochytrium arcticum]|nr:hypothetical protein DFS34DRAFT_399293 [Phlyctochytrium arcticum]
MMAVAAAASVAAAAAAAASVAGATPTTLASAPFYWSTPTTSATITTTMAWPTPYAIAASQPPPSIAAGSVFEPATTIPFIAPSMDDQVIAQHVELTSFVVLLLWNRIPLDKLLRLWSPSDNISSPKSNPLAFLHGPFRKYVELLLVTTKVSSSVVVLALKYLQRIAQNRHLLPPSSPLLTSAAPHMALLVSLVLANKFADDERFTNAAWAQVANTPLSTLNQAERDALLAMDVRLQVHEGEYTAWVAKLEKFAADAASALERQELYSQQLAERQALAQQKADLQRRLLLQYYGHQAKQHYHPYSHPDHNQHHLLNIHQTNSYPYTSVSPQTYPSPPDYNNPYMLPYTLYAHPQAPPPNPPQIASSATPSHILMGH